MSQKEGTQWQHRTVLLHEAVDALVHNPSGTYLDATFGRGGHSRLILSRLAPTGRLLALDRDPQAIAHATSGAQAISDPRFSALHARFATLADAAASQRIARFDGVLFDLGVSSPQFDDPARGFSFRHDAPLDMRMDPSSSLWAARFLAESTEQEIARVIREFGEERFAKAIARAIVARREAGEPVQRTGELTALCARVVKTRERGQDPATRTFQALRMHVNDELGEIAQALGASLALLAPLGRLVVISFHSLEDRLVKTFIAQHAKAAFDRRAPMAPAAPTLLRALQRVKPGAVEVASNPRARSEVMRVAERTDAPQPAAHGARA
jgi:16S rRNA (cytosine1402-N4)-methyltransferase